MQNLSVYNSSDLKKLINFRKGETKFGESVKTISNYTTIYESISKLDVEYVIFGISEDIGVFANFGKPGTQDTWQLVLKSLLNIQDNCFTNPKKVLILGHLSFEDIQKKITLLDRNNKSNLKKIRDFVSEIDEDVTYLISLIIKAGKKPIIIGGGHNNSYGNIKGAALALNKEINCINIDAHTDFRSVDEGRHSGNGFSFAYSEGFLKKYFVVGLHENYTSQKLFKIIKKIKSFKFITYEDIEVRQKVDLNAVITNTLEHVGKSEFGIELDCDSILGIESSAMSPSGFSVATTRQMIQKFSKNKNAVYLHICEAKPTKKDKQNVGKLISFLITDFMS